MPVEDIVIGRDREDTEKYGKKGCVFIGKHIVGAGYETHYTNPVLMDVMRPHVMMIVGKRGTGKSYSGAVIGEEIMNLDPELKKNLSYLMIDTMGIFWSMKTPNDEALVLLKKWGLDPKSFPILNVIPHGLKERYEKFNIEYDKTFSIRPSDLSVGEWALTFGINIFEPLGILLERAFEKLESSYSIEDIINAIGSDKKSEEKERLALQNRFSAAGKWGIFSEKATSVASFLKPGVATVLDISQQEWNVRNLMLGILSREIYNLRTSARREEEASKIAGETVRKIPMTWMIMDEAHNFLPNTGETAATAPLLRLVKEGRHPGISLVFITQRPNKLHDDVIAQSDLIISHRLTAKPDLDALSAVMQTYLLEDLKRAITNLPRTKGSAVVLDDNSERMFQIQIRPRQSWHAGASPIALKEK